MAATLAALCTLLALTSSLRLTVRPQTQTHPAFLRGSGQFWSLLHYLGHTRSAMRPLPLHSAQLRLNPSLRRVTGYVPHVELLATFPGVAVRARVAGDVDQETNIDGRKPSGKDVLEKLKRRPQPRAQGRWETDLLGRCSVQVPTLIVREATRVEDIWGASVLLASRNALSNDQPGLSEILEPFLGLSYMRAISSVSLRSPLTVVAIANEEVIGMAEVKVDGYVRNLAVHRGWRRRGVGSQLLCWCAEQARTRGASELWMHVSVDNEDGINFYSRLEFTFGTTEVFGPRQELGQRLSKPL